MHDIVAAGSDINQLVKQTAAHFHIFDPNENQGKDFKLTLQTLFKGGSRQECLANGMSCLLPELNTNHRDTDGSITPRNNDTAYALLLDILKQLQSPVLSITETRRAPIGMKSRPLTGLERINNEYAIEKTLGEGSFGKVKLGIHLLTGKKVAIKCLEKSRVANTVGSSERLLREIVLLAHLDHPNICKLLQVIDTSQTIYLVMEYEAGGELYDFLLKFKKLDEDTARFLFRQILCAVHYCHGLDIVHRDLKPENIMLDESGNVKLIDFGFANVVRGNKTLETFCGSAAYAAPEMIGNKKYHGYETDAWALGVILYVLVCGEMPFDDKHMSRMYVAIMSGKFKAFPPDVSQEFKDLVTHILKVKPNERATIHDMRNHPWTNHQGKLNLVHFCCDPKTRAVSCSECALPPNEQETSEYVSKLMDLGYREADVVNALKNQYPSSAFATLCLLNDHQDQMKRMLSKLQLYDDRFSGKLWTQVNIATSEPDTKEPEHESLDQTALNPSRIVIEESEETTASFVRPHSSSAHTYRKVVSSRRKMELAADAWLVKKRKEQGKNEHNVL